MGARARVLENTLEKYNDFVRVLSRAEDTRTITHGCI